MLKRPGNQKDYNNRVFTSHLYRGRNWKRPWVGQNEHRRFRAVLGEVGCTTYPQEKFTPPSVWLKKY